jgi:PAS domain S-box-containing protein
MRNTGIEIIGEAPWGTHFCQFYQTPQDLTEILVPYFKAGLEQGEFCMWITSPDLTHDQAEAALRAAVPGYEARRQQGQIEILPHTEWYLKGGTFELKRVLDGWVAKLEQAQAKGFAGMRLSGNTVWLEKKDWRSFTDYERAINEVVGQYPMMALCTYSLARCGAVEILDVVRNHQFALIKGERGWEVIESSDQKKARESEQRYRALTAALQAANESVSRDLTERQRMEEELRTASLYARSLIEASLDPLVTISPQGKITDVNRATELATGLTRAQLIGSDFSGYFTEPDQARAGYQRVIAAGEVRDYALTIRHVSGRTMDVLYNATVYRNEAGQVQGVFAAARDITELKAAQRRRDVTNALLELSARKFSRGEFLEGVVEVIRGWMDAQCLGIRLVDEQGHIPYAAWAGFEREFLERESRLSLAQDNCCCTRAITQQLEEQDRPWLTPGGSFCYPHLPRFIQQLPAEKQARYRGACAQFGFASLGVVLIRYREKIVGAIHLADRRPGHFAPAMLEFLESITPLIGEAVLRFQAEAELSKYREQLEELVKQRTGELESSNAQLHLEIAERKRAEGTLRQTARELARSNGDLEQFAYVASHDLQEPLRAMAGYVSLLQRRYPDALDAKGLHYIQEAASGATRMQTLIDDLLSFSRVQTKGRTFEPTDLDAALEQALKNVHAAIEEAGAVVTREPLPTLRVDATQITQLFQNLLGNAVKFRSQAPPQIHLSAQRRPAEWLFGVRDNGIGIEPQYYERIFQIFQRLHTRQHYPGTGIGLALCKKIVERHGGSIWVESQPGAGATFYFTIPDRATKLSEEN